MYNRRVGGRLQGLLQRLDGGVIDAAADGEGRAGPASIRRGGEGEPWASLALGMGKTGAPSWVFGCESRTLRARIAVVGTVFLLPGVHISTRRSMKQRREA